MKYKEKAIVIKQDQLVEGIYSIWLKTENIAHEAVAGQFVNVYTPSAGHVLPRPISLCEIDVGQFTEAFYTNRCRKVYQVHI